MSQIKRDIASYIAPLPSLGSAAPRTATVNGTGVDILGFAAVALLADVGTFGGTTPTATIRWEESDDNVTFTAIAAADLDGGLIAGLTGATVPGIIKRGYVGTKRYVRGAVSAIGGTSPSLPLTMSVIRAGSDVNPVSLIGG